MTGHTAASERGRVPDLPAARSFVMDGMPRMNRFGRKVAGLSSLFTQCAAPGQVVVLSIDDITNGDGEYLLYGNTKKGLQSFLSCFTKET